MFNFAERGQSQARSVDRGGRDQPKRWRADLPDATDGRINDNLTLDCQIQSTTVARLSRRMPASQTGRCAVTAAECQSRGIRGRRGPDLVKTVVQLPRCAASPSHLLRKSEAHMSGCASRQSRKPSGTSGLVDSPPRVCVKGITGDRPMAPGTMWSVPVLQLVNLGVDASAVSRRTCAAIN